MENPRSEEFGPELVRSDRATVGVEHWSGTYFDASGEEQFYLRDDLVLDADTVGFADNERLGFRSKSVYRGSELGEYRFTIRVFEHGYLTRVIADEDGAFVTTDSLP